MKQGSGIVWSVDLPVVGGLLGFGTWILIRMAYLPIYLSTIYTLAFLGVAWLYLLKRWQIRVPPILGFMIYLTAALDGVGNFFNMYNRHFELIQYDEFTHATSPALVAPVLVWLLDHGLRRSGYRLPPGIVTFFAITTMFTIAGFYEILELWDDKYMHPAPGMRIHGPYDTSNDLQWNLCGMVIGGLIAWLLLRRSALRDGVLAPAG
jgi:uncharacterized membrane protein YjdF